MRASPSAPVCFRQELSQTEGKLVVLCLVSTYQTGKMKRMVEGSFIELLWFCHSQNTQMKVGDSSNLLFSASGAVGLFKVKAGRL